MRSKKLISSFSDERIPIISELLLKINSLMPSKHFFICGYTKSGSRVSAKIVNKSSFERKKNRGNSNLLDSKCYSKLYNIKNIFLPFLNFLYQFLTMIEFFLKVRDPVDVQHLGISADVFHYHVPGIGNYIEFAGLAGERFGNILEGKYGFEIQ